MADKKATKGKKEKEEKKKTSELSEKELNMVSGGLKGMRKR